jgi:hypothetical protein
MTTDKRSVKATSDGTPAGSSAGTPAGSPAGSSAELSGNSSTGTHFPAGSYAKSTLPPAKKSPFKKISVFSEKWTGKSPQDIAPDQSRDDIPRYSDKDLLDTAIGVHGYIKLQGEYEGRPRPFVVMCCTTLDNIEVPFTVSSSGVVIIKKLERVAEKSGFPVMGKLIKEKSYFDFVDCDESTPSPSDGVPDSQTSEEGVPF